MPIQTSYTEARANLAKLLDRVTDDREKVIIKRRGGANVVLIAEDELNSIEETAYLLRSPKNATRLIAAYERARGRTEQPQTVKELRSELGIDAAE